MSERWRTRDGWAVEVVVLSGTSHRRWDGTWLRLTHHGVYVADVSTPAELEHWVPLAELEPDVLAAHGQRWVRTRSMA